MKRLVAERVGSLSLGSYGEVRFVEASRAWVRSVPVSLGS